MLNQPRQGHRPPAPSQQPYCFLASVSHREDVGSGGAGFGRQQYSTGAVKTHQHKANSTRSLVSQLARPALMSAQYTPCTIFHLQPYRCLADYQMRDGCYGSPLQAGTRFLGLMDHIALLVFCTIPVPRLGNPGIISSSPWSH